MLRKAYIINIRIHNTSIIKENLICYTVNKKNTDFIFIAKNVLIEDLSVKCAVCNYSGVHSIGVRFD